MLGALCPHSAAAQTEPQLGTFLRTSPIVAGSAEPGSVREQRTTPLADEGQSGAFPTSFESIDLEFGCMPGDIEPLESTLRGTYTDNDATHYARGSVLTVLVFVNHDGGTWQPEEMAEQGAKSHDAKQFYLEYMPAAGFIRFDNQSSDEMYYYTADVPYDIDDYPNFENWMINDAIESIGFEDDDADGSNVDEMTLWLQNWNGGWDNVIPVFIPADYTFETAQAGTSTAWCKVSLDMSWGTWAHEWGHVFGACDEGGGPGGCNGLGCDDVCQSGYLVDQVPNGNCNQCTDGVDCIMRGYVNVAPCEFTYRNWGWVDDDGNGLLDATVAWDPFADDVYQIHELFHNGWFIHTNTTWGMVANQEWTSWSAVGVRSRDASNYAISLYGDSNRSYHLASDYISPGVRFVVGDFNHNNLGQDNIRLVNTGGAGQYVLSYEAGTQVLYPDGVDRAQTWSSNHVVRAFDVPLFAGETIQFQLDVDTAGLDLGMALFKSDGDTYYAPKTSAVWQANSWPAGTSESYTFEVPEDDVYGLVVWSETELAGNFSIKIGPTLAALAEATPFTSGLDLRLFSYAPYTSYWGVAGVRPGASSNVTLSLFRESTFQTELATSGAYPGIEFIAADYHPNYSTDYLRVSRESGATLHTTEWEQGPDILSGFEDGTWGSGHVCKVWDVYLQEGQTYRFQQYGEILSVIDARIYVFSSASGDRYIQRSGASAGAGGGSPLGEWFTFTAPADDWYGFVMIVDDDSDGDYVVGVGPYMTLAEQVPVDLPDEVLWADVATEAGSWNVVGVRPDAGSESAMSIWSCEDRFDNCFLTSDLSGDPVAFVVVDGNHVAAAPYYARADRVSGLGHQTISFDTADTDILFNNPGDIESATDSFAEDEVVQVWDLNATVAPMGLGVTVVPLSGDLDLSVAVFRSTPGNYVQASTDALGAEDNEGPGGVERVRFTSSGNDVYGLVVTNRSGTAGSYEVHVHAADATDVGEVETPSALDMRALGTVSRSPSLELSLPEASFVQLDVFDVGGRHVQKLMEAPLAAGVHVVAWSEDGSGSDLGSGLYFVRLRALDQERTIKILRHR